MTKIIFQLSVSISQPELHIYEHLVWSFFLTIYNIESMLNTSPSQENSNDHGCRQAGLRVNTIATELYRLSTNTHTPVVVALK